MRYEPASWESTFTACQPGMTAFVDYSKSLGFGTLGCYVDRGVNGDSSVASTHREGRGYDLTRGWKDDTWVTEYMHRLVEHFNELGVQQIIWQRKFWRCDRTGWHDYHGADPHTSHAHIELNKTAAQSLTIEAIRTILEDDDMTPADIDTLASAIVNRAMEYPITTRYDVGTPGEHEITIELRQLIGNAYIEQQKR